MHRRGVMFLFLLPATGGGLVADPANGDPRKEKLYSMFIAPCCWRENLMVHHSPKADELRAEITGLIKEGRTDGEIKQRMVEQYTGRILAQLEGAKGEWLSWMPVAAAMAGLGAIGVYLQRSMAARKRAVAAEVVAELPETEWSENER